MHKIYSSLKGIIFLKFSSFSHRNCHAPFFVGDGFGSYHNEGKHSRMIVFDNESDFNITKINDIYFCGCGMTKEEYFSSNKKFYGDGEMHELDLRDFLLFEENA